MSADENFNRPENSGLVAYLLTGPLFTVGRLFMWSREEIPLQIWWFDATV